MSLIVSIVMPCRNEEAHVEQAVLDALAQERRDFDLEVLVAVGPGHDHTHSIVKRLTREHASVQLVENPAGVVPHGLNEAIRRSHGKYIVRMDAHSRYPQDYVVTLIEALERLKADNVGGVWETLPSGDSDEAWAIAQVLRSPLGVGNAMFRLGTGQEREVDTVPYGCFRREIFDRLGFFDEELVRNQDDEHNGRIIRAGGRIFLLPQVRIIYYGRDRIWKLWRMYREYGLFKPLVNIKLGRPATLRQFVPPLFVLALAVLPALALWKAFFGWAWSGMIALYILVVALTAARVVIRGQRQAAWAWVVVGFFCVHVAYGFGYLQGMLRFVILQRRIRPEQIGTNR